MSCYPSKRYRDLIATHLAFENIFGIGAKDGHKGRSGFITNPTTGALVVSPVLRMKVRKALKAKLRRMKFRLYFRLAVPYFSKIKLKCGNVAINIIRNLNCRLLYMFIR